MTQMKAAITIDGIDYDYDYESTNCPDCNAQVWKVSGQPDQRCFKCIVSAALVRSRLLRQMTAHAKHERLDASGYKLQDLHRVVAVCICKKCNTQNEQAEPNQSDGSYVCFNCR